MRADDLVFDGSRGPKDFIDLESGMNSYFRWYPMDDNLHVEYAEMRLGGHAKIFWKNERHAAYRRGQPITSWTDMAQLLKNKYVPREYEPTLFPRQGKMPVREHMEHMVRPTPIFFHLSLMRRSLLRDLVRPLQLHRHDPAQGMDKLHMRCQ